MKAFEKYMKAINNKEMNYNSDKSHKSQPIIKKHHQAKTLSYSTYRRKNLLLIQIPYYLKQRKIIQKNILKYNETKNSYNNKIIQSLIFDEKISIVSKFKDYLFWNEISEFLRRFYAKYEAIERLPKICEYYEKYTLIPPTYAGHDIMTVKIMKRFLKRKKRYLEYIEDHEDDYKYINKENKGDFELLIKPEMVYTDDKEKNDNKIYIKKQEDKRTKRLRKELSQPNSNKDIEQEKTVDLTQYQNDNNKSICSLISHWSRTINHNPIKKNKNTIQNNKSNKDYNTVGYLKRIIKTEINSIIKDNNNSNNNSKYNISDRKYKNIGIKKLNLENILHPQSIHTITLPLNRKNNSKSPKSNTKRLVIKKQKILYNEIGGTSKNSPLSSRNSIIKNGNTARIAKPIIFNDKSSRSTSKKHSKIRLHTDYKRFHSSNKSAIPNMKDSIKTISKRNKIDEKKYPYLYSNDYSNENKFSVSNNNTLNKTNNSKKFDNKLSKKQFLNQIYGKLYKNPVSLKKKNFKDEKEIIKNIINRKKNLMNK